MGERVEVPEWLAFAEVERRPPVKPTTLQELAAITGKALTLTEHSDDRWTCCLRGVEVRQGIAGLLSEYGTGLTPESAAIDYAAKLTGQRIVVNAMNPDTRREYGLGEVVAR
jgi:hypothetical protein